MVRTPALLCGILWIASVAGVARSAQAQEDYQVLYASGRDNLPQPWSGLIRASDGNFYGGSVTGLYRLTPEGDYSVLANLGGSVAHLIQASDGDLYVIVSQSRIARVALDGTLTILHQIKDSALEGLLTRTLAEGVDGNLYGITRLNILHPLGTLYRITPDGVFTTIRPLTALEGNGTFVRLLRAEDGVLFGWTQVGGEHGKGGVFQLSTDGSTTFLHSFTGGRDGDRPETLVAARDGHLYGTTEVGGAHGGGTVFHLRRDGLLTTLYDFKPEQRMEARHALLEASDGSLYGTSDYTIFRLSSSGLHLLHSTMMTYPGWAANGRYGSDIVGLLEGPDGNFYGATRDGGPGSRGVIFRLNRQRTPCANELGLNWQPFNDGSGNGVLYMLGVLKTETPAFLMSLLVSDRGVTPLDLRLTSPVTPTFVYEIALPFSSMGTVGVFTMVLTSGLDICDDWTTADTGGAGPSASELQQLLKEWREGRQR